MALNTCETWFNGIKIAFFFPNKLQKNCPSSGGLLSRPPKPPVAESSASRPRLWYLGVTLVYSTRLSIYIFAHFSFGFKQKSPLSKILVTCQTQSTASNLPFYDIFARKSSSFENFWWRHCMWCGLPTPPIKNPAHAYASSSEDKNKRRTNWVNKIDFDSKFFDIFLTFHCLLFFSIVVVVFFFFGILHD